MAEKQSGGEAGVSYGEVSFDSSERCMMTGGERPKIYVNTGWFFFFFQAEDGIRDKGM